MKKTKYTFTKGPTFSDDPKGNARRKTLFNTIRPFVAIVPIAVVLASFRWRVLDQWLSTYPTAAWFLQLLLATIFAIPTVEIVIRYLRRQQSRAKLRTFENDTSSNNELKNHLLDVFSIRKKTSGIVIIADDSKILGSVASCRLACSDLGLLPISLDMYQLMGVVRSADVTAALNELRGIFLKTAIGVGLQESAALDLWNLSTVNSHLVVIAQFESTDDVFDNDDFCFKARERITSLQNLGLQVVVVGTSRAAAVIDRPVLVDTTAEYWARAYLFQKSISLTTDFDGSGAQFLLEILTPYLDGHSLIKEELEAVCRLRRARLLTDTEARIDEAAKFLSVHQWSKSSQRDWIINILSTTSRGIDVLAIAISRYKIQMPDDWEHNFTVDLNSSFIAIKRFLTISTEVVSSERLVELLNQISRTQRLDVIKSMEFADSSRFSMLATMATHSDLFTRFAAATKFSMSVKSQEDPNLNELLRRWLSAPHSGGMDDDYKIGALGWILPSLVVHFWSNYRDIWDLSISIATQRDPSHLQLSLARGLCLTALQAPEQTLSLVEEVFESGVGFWLTDIKLAHAAGISASALGLNTHYIVDSLTSSKHDLVSESATIVQIGLQQFKSPEVWTWGLESFETRATQWPHDERTKRLMARVALGASLYWNSVTPDSFEKISHINHSSYGAPKCILHLESGSSLLNGQCEKKCVHQMCSISSGLTQLSVNDAESAKGEFGIAFCLDQARLAQKSSKSQESKHLWHSLALSSHEYGRQ